MTICRGAQLRRAGSVAADRSSPAAIKSLNKQAQGQEAGWRGFSFSPLPSALCRWAGRVDTLLSGPLARLDLLPHGLPPARQSAALSTHPWTLMRLWLVSAGEEIWTETLLADEAAHALCSSCYKVANTVGRSHLVSSWNSFYSPDVVTGLNEQCNGAQRGQWPWLHNGQINVN